MRQISTKRKAATIFSKSSNSCLHCQNENILTLWFVVLTVTMVQKLHKKGSINFYCHWKDILLAVFLRPRTLEVRWHFVSSSLLSQLPQLTLSCSRLCLYFWCPKLRVGTQLIFNLSHDCAGFPETKCRLHIF